MHYRTLGRTGINVSVIGLGTEYLPKEREVVVQTIHRALNHGVNYIDTLFSFPYYLDNLNAALRGKREDVFLAGHLGSGEKNGQYQKTRNLKKAKAYFLDLLKRLDTDHVDILMLHNCDSQQDYHELMKPNGILGLAQRLKQEGKARFLGFSGHTVNTARQALESGVVDMLMFPINLSAHTEPGKKELLQMCVRHNIGIVAMKPYGGGKLLSKDRTVEMVRYQRGGEMLKITKTAPITAVQCLAYALAQPGVSTIIPGCAAPEHVDAALAYLEASDAEKDFVNILADFEQYTPGECVYCNHCLPCPSTIDIGYLMRLLDSARQQLTDELKNAYGQLTALASDCTECGACEKRCPFDVKVIEHMRQTVTLFEA